jgi:hypothetical protein
VKMSEGHDGSLDLADIEVGAPPAGWSPDVVDSLPDAIDVVDLDEEPGA